MKTALMASACAALLALCWLFAESALAARQVRRTVADLPRVVDARIAAEAALTRQAASQQIHEARVALVNETRGSRADLRQMVAGAIDKADTRLATIQADLVTQVTLTRAEARAQLQDTNRTLALARQDFAGAADGLRALTVSTDRAVVLLTPQALGLVAASKVAAGETAQTMRAVRDAAPEITRNVEKTTANVERITRPDSLAVRVLKAVSPAIGGAILGALK
jgi:hypothetical protein